MSQNLSSKRQAGNVPPLAQKFRDAASSTITQQDSQRQSARPQNQKQYELLQERPASSRAPLNNPHSVMQKHGVTVRPQIQSVAAQEDLKPMPLTQVQNPQAVKLESLEQILTKFGEFPEKYRLYSWQTLLGLPLNEKAFNTVISKGLHPSYTEPLYKGKLGSRMQFLLSALAHWCEIVPQITFLGHTLAPFAKLIGEEVFLLEVCMSVIVHWMQSWFECFPAAPVPTMQVIDQVIQTEDLELYSHFQKLGFTAREYAWPLLRSMMCQNLTSFDWQKMFDHLFLHFKAPDLLNYIVTSYLLLHKRTIMTRVFCREDLFEFQNDLSVVSIKRILSLSIQLYHNYRPSLFAGAYALNLPLKPVDGVYEQFLRYPIQFVQFQGQVQEQMREEQKKVKEKEKQVQVLQNQATQALRAKEAYDEQQETIRMAETARLNEMRREYQELQSKKAKLLEDEQLAKLTKIKANIDQINQMPFINQ